MTDYSNLVIQPLDSRHDRPGFRCGVASLDAYIRKRARQDVKRRVSRVFVAAAAEHPNTIVGYYTLSIHAIELSHLPEALARKLPSLPYAPFSGLRPISQLGVTGIHITPGIDDADDWSSLKFLPAITGLQA